MLALVVVDAFAVWVAVVAGVVSVILVVASCDVCELEPSLVPLSLSLCVQPTPSPLVIDDNCGGHSICSVGNCPGRGDRNKAS